MWAFTRFAHTHCILQIKEHGADTAVFFEIADRSGVPMEDATNATAFRVEIDIRAAIDNLNATIQKDSLKIESLGITIGKASFEEIPKDMYPPPAPPVPPTPAPAASGGGGGTAVLAVSMLVVGVVLGILGAWWMWKRQRGIPYHIYE